MDMLFTGRSPELQIKILERLKRQRWRNRSNLRLPNIPRYEGCEVTYWRCIECAQQELENGNLDASLEALYGAALAVKELVSPMPDIGYN